MKFLIIKEKYSVWNRCSQDQCGKEDVREAGVLGIPYIQASPFSLFSGKSTFVFHQHNQKHCQLPGYKQHFCGKTESQMSIQQTLNVRDTNKKEVFEIPLPVSKAILTPRLSDQFLCCRAEAQGALRGWFHSPTAPPPNTERNCQDKMQP